MFKVKTYVVLSGGGRLFGPFDMAEAAAKFLEANYASFSGHSRVECVWDPAPYEKTLKAVA